MDRKPGRGHEIDLATFEAIILPQRWKTVVGEQLLERGRLDARIVFRAGCFVRTDIRYDRAESVVTADEVAASILSLCSNVAQVQFGTCLEMMCKEMSA